MVFMLLGAAKVETISAFQETESPVILPLYLSGISAGFPSPADDYLDKKLSLDELLIRNSTATFLIQVSGHSMIGAGILDKAIAVVDRSIKPSTGDIVTAIVDNEFLIKRMQIIDGAVYLIAENPKYGPIRLDEENGDCIWGVVTAVINKFK